MICVFNYMKIFLIKVSVPVMFFVFIIVLKDHVIKLYLKIVFEVYYIVVNIMSKKILFLLLLCLSF